MPKLGKTQRRKYLSEYLQSNEVGELNNFLDMTTFIQIYDKFYDNNNKINIDDIQKICIDRECVLQDLNEDIWTKTQNLHLRDNKT